MTDFPSFPVSESAARIAELEAVIDRADQHTAMLMKSIDGFEERLKAAEYAARVNYDGWQQEIARSSCHAQPSPTSPVTETPVVKSFAGSTKDDRCLEVWFASEVTDATRAWLLEAINEKALRSAIQSTPASLETAERLVDDLLQTSLDYERAEGFEAKYRRQDFEEAKQAVRNALTAGLAQCQQERGWLIEWPEDETVPARWWNPATGWMRDANKAMRFARECDAADYVAANTFVTSVRPTEHVFGLSLSSTDCEGE
jgi:hypothetical protein